MNLEKTYKIDPIVGLEYYGEENTIDIEVDNVHAFHAINPKSNNYDSISHNSAHIAILNCDHPDIEKFIVCKQGENNKELTQFNISVGITKKFMEAAENNKDWDLIFNGKIFKTVKAKDLYSSIMNNAFFHNEPGVLFIDRVNEDNNAPDSFKIDTTNPCFTGDTIIATADGRNGVSIKQLAEENKVFPVYSARINKSGGNHGGGWKSEIKKATAFKTGIKEVIEVVLSDGSSFKCTPDHLLATADGEWIEAKDSEKIKLAKFYTFSDKNSSKNYRTINSKSNAYNRQYRMIWEYYNNKYDGKDFNIDHIDEKASNDSITNLQLISIEDHKLKTKRVGDDNPLFRMDYEHRRWVSKKRNILGNAKRWEWSEERLNETMKNFLEKNPKPIKEDKNIYLDEDIFVEEIVSLEEYEDVYDLTVEDNHNFYIITNTDDNNFMNCSGILVHNCGEIPMQPYSVCCLSSINLTKFIINPFEDDYKFDFDQLEKTIEVAIRFLDNVLDVTKYPLPQIEEQSKMWRRIGLGFTGFADMFAMMKIKYNSKEALNFTDTLAKFFRDISYSSSINLSAEKGSYPGFKYEEIKKSHFFKNLPNNLKNQIKDFGLRNVGVNTTAPVGTGSLSFGNNCSSGIEPIFSLEYDRKIRTGKGEETTSDKVYDYAWLLYKEKFPNSKTVPEFFVTTFDINPYESIDMQATWQKYIDHSISKTINLPNKFTFEEYENLFKYAFEKGLKGATTFNPNGSIPGVLSVDKKVKKEILENVNAPKRPIELPCDIHEITFDKVSYIVLCGFYEGKMYEIFVTPNLEKSEGIKSIDIQKHTKGFIKKIKRGQYELIVKNGEDKIILDNIGKSLEPTFASLSRFISMSLRHGVSLEFIVEQLQKDSNFISFERVVSRVLKKYIKDGQKSTHKCDDCGSTLEFREGCLVCTNCGFSKCG